MLATTQAPVSGAGNYLGTSTWAARPTPANSSDNFLCTDIGSAPGTRFQWTGAYWRPTAASLILKQSSTPVSVTGSVAATNLATATLPGGFLQAGCAIRTSAAYSFVVSANAKDIRLRVSGSVVTGQGGISGAGSQQWNVLWTCFVASVSQVRFVGGGASFGGNGGGVVNISKDLTVDQTLTLEAQLSNTGDTATLENYIVEVLFP